MKIRYGDRVLMLLCLLVVVAACSIILMNYDHELMVIRPRAIVASLDKDGVTYTMIETNVEGSITHPMVEIELNSIRTQVVGTVIWAWRAE